MDAEKKCSSENSDCHIVIVHENWKQEWEQKKLQCIVCITQYAQKDKSVNRNVAFISKQLGSIHSKNRKW